MIGPLMYKFGQLPVYRGRGDAGLVLKQAEQALREGACVIVYPEGTATRDPDLWPMVGQDRRRPAGADHRGAGDPDRALGRAGDPPLRVEEAPPVPAQDRADGRPGRRWTCPPTPASGWARARCARPPPTSWPTSPPCWPRSGRRRRPPYPGIPPRAAVFPWPNAGRCHVWLRGQPRRGGASADRNRLRSGMKAAVLGAGSWGTTFAQVLCDAGTRDRAVRRKPQLAKALAELHENPEYLPGDRADPGARRDAGPRRGAGRRGPGRLRRARAVAAGQPGRLGAADPARRAAGQPASRGSSSARASG